MKEKREYCHTRAKKANSKRLLSPEPIYNVTPWEVWHIIKEAKGRCAHCGSLAVEKRASNEKGHPIPWSNVGRRVGSLGHHVARFHGGGNELNNLLWCCLWCNDWASERVAGATNHGGYYSEEPDQDMQYENPYPKENITRDIEATARRRKTNQRRPRPSRRCRTAAQTTASSGNCASRSRSTRTPGIPFAAPARCAAGVDT